MWLWPSTKWLCSLLKGCRQKHRLSACLWWYITAAAFSLSYWLLPLLRFITSAYLCLIKHTKKEISDMWIHMTTDPTWLYKPDSNVQCSTSKQLTSLDYLWTPWEAGEESQGIKTNMPQLQQSCTEIPPLCLLGNLLICPRTSVQAKCVFTWCRHGLRLVLRSWRRNHLPWKWRAKLHGATGSLQAAAVCCQLSTTGHQRQIPLYYPLDPHTLIHSPKSYKIKLVILTWSFCCYRNNEEFLSGLHSVAPAPESATSKNNSIICQNPGQSVFLSSTAASSAVVKPLQHRKLSRAFRCYKSFLCCSASVLTRETAGRFIDVPYSSSLFFQ